MRGFENLSEQSLLRASPKELSGNPNNGIERHAQATEESTISTNGCRGTTSKRHLISLSKPRDYYGDVDLLVILKVAARHGVAPR